jgi:hypothetical protein
MDGLKNMQALVEQEQKHFLSVSMLVRDLTRILELSDMGSVGVCKQADKRAQRFSAEVSLSDIWPQLSMEDLSNRHLRPVAEKIVSHIKSQAPRGCVFVKLECASLAKEWGVDVVTGDKASVRMVVLNPLGSNGECQLRFDVAFYPLA